MSTETTNENSIFESGETSRTIRYDITINGEQIGEYREQINTNPGDGTLGHTLIIERKNEETGLFEVVVPGNDKDWKEIQFSIERDQALKDELNSWYIDEGVRANWWSGEYPDDQDSEAIIASEALNRELISSGMFNLTTQFANIPESEGGGLREDGQQFVAFAGTNFENTVNYTVDETGFVENADQTVTAEKIFSKGPFKENLIYPEDMLIEFGGQDYIFFEQFEYVPPQPSINQQLRADLNPSEGDETNIARVLDKSGLSRGTNLATDSQNQERRFGTCALPIPNRLGVSNGVSWGEGRANAIEMAAFGATSGSISTAMKDGKILEVLKDGLSQAGDVFKELSGQFKDNEGGATAANLLSGVLARSLLGQIGINVDVDQFITRQTGQAINPNLELLFSGPQLRTFSFDFNFAPNNSKEAVIVRKIMRWFRQGMLPKKNVVGSGSLFLGSPNVFRLCYRNHNRRIKGLNTFKICALTACQINFTPDGVYQSYEDEAAASQPVRSTMALTFNELTPIFANDYNNDLNSTDSSIVDLGPNLRDQNAITDDDIGF